MNAARYAFSVSIGVESASSAPNQRYRRVVDSRSGVIKSICGCPDC